MYADVADDAYAALSLRIRDGAAGDPGTVFDQLAGRGQVHLHPSVDELRAYVAGQAAGAHRAGKAVAVSVATNEQARALNSAIRDQLVASGDVDDATVATTGTGQRLGAGDLVATRVNDVDLGVANRDTWTVLAAHRDGSLSVTPTVGSAAAGERTLPAGYVNRHVQLGYAGTIHSVQGETAHAAHLVLDEHTSAAAAYVGMTRGRTGNTVHLIGQDLAGARAQWIGAAGRGWPDLGVEAARAHAERAADQYAAPTPRPAAADDARRARVLDQLHGAWTEQAHAREQLARLEPRLARARTEHDRRQDRHQENERVLGPLREQVRTTRAAADAADQQAAVARSLLQQHSKEIHALLRADWDTDRPLAAEAAATVQAGPGRLGRLTGARAAVRDAERLLNQWAQKWRPVKPEPADAAAAARLASQHPGNDQIGEAIERYAHRRAGQEHPDQVRLIEAAEHARQNAQNAAHTYAQTSSALGQRQAVRTARTGYPDPPEALPQLAEQTAAARARLHAADQRVQRLAADPAITAGVDPAGFLAAAHTSWNGDHIAAQAAASQQTQHAAARHADETARQRIRQADRHHGPNHGPSTRPDGPSIGR